MRQVSIYFFFFIFSFHSSYAKEKGNVIDKSLHFTATRTLPFSSELTLEGGMITLLMKHLFQQANIPITVSYHQHEKWQGSFEVGTPIGHFPVFMTDKNKTLENDVLASKIMDVGFYIYSISVSIYKDKFLRKKVEPKKIKTICVPKHLLNIQGLEAAVKQKFTYITGLTTNDCKLSLQRNLCDGFLDEAFHAQSIGLLEDTEDLVLIERQSKPFFVTGLYVIFNKNLMGIKKVKDYFDRELKKAHESGDFQGILNRFQEYWATMY